MGLREDLATRIGIVPVISHFIFAVWPGVGSFFPKWRILLWIKIPTTYFFVDICQNWVTHFSWHLSGNTDVHLPISGSIWLVKYPTWTHYFDQSNGRAYFNQSESYWLKKKSAFASFFACVTAKENSSINDNTLLYCATCGAIYWLENGEAANVIENKVKKFHGNSKNIAYMEVKTIKSIYWPYQW